jgi:Domain of unknown function (DUF5134)
MARGRARRRVGRRGMGSGPMTPTWILDVVALVMIAVAAVNAARLVLAKPWRPGSIVIDADVAHLLMAIAMAGMLAPSLRTLPTAAWEVIFAVLIALFAIRVARDARANGIRALAGGHCAPHLVHSASMLYISLAMPAAAAAGLSGTLMLRYPTLAFAFALILIGYTIWDLDQLSGKRYSLTSARVSLAGVAAAAVPATADVEPDALLLSPAVTVGCRVAMGVAMAFMLLIAI